MEKPKQRGEWLREKIERLVREEVGVEPAGQANEEVLEELASMLEELHSSEEELRTRNEALASSREALENERKRYNRLFDLGPDPFVVTTSQGVIREANRAAAEKFKTPEKYLAGKPLVVFIQEQDKKAFHRAVRDLSTSHLALAIDLNLRPREGRAVTMMTTAARMSADNEEQILWMMKDVSESKRSEHELRRANEELDRYARTVSHDLKGPLAGILLGADFARESVERLPAGQDREEIEETLGAIENNARTAYALVMDLLLQANVGGRDDLEAEIDVREQVDKVLRNEALFQGRDVKVEVDHDLGVVRATPTNVFQLFNNLIGNAVKHNSTPEPVILIKALGEAQEGQRRFRVSDNGPGIPSSTILRLSHCLHKGEGDGLGIGLTIVCDIVRRYGGALGAYNDGGSHVEFSLPGAAGQRSLEAIGETGLRVLVVEDEPGTAFMIGRLLKKRFDSEVVVAGDLAEARRLLGESYFDLVTIDYKLPDGTGLELLEEMAQNDGHPPAVVLTGRGDEKIASRSFALGASGYVVKDENVGRELPEAVLLALSRRHGAAGPGTAPQTGN